MDKRTILLVSTVALWLLSFVAFARCYSGKVESNRRLIEEVEFLDSLNNYNKIYYDGQFNDLKKTNIELYDSLRKYKDKVSFLIQFSYEKEHNTGIVHTKPNTVIRHDTVLVEAGGLPTTFTYNSEPNDTFQYELKINSEKEPNWYSLKTRFKDKFTIVNKDDGNGLNHITVGSEGGGSIGDVTVFKKKDKRKLKDRVGFGPSVTAGYDPLNKNFGIVVGVGVTIDLK